VAFLPLVAFLLGFFLFAASSALTYLSVRSWVRSRPDQTGFRSWRVPQWSHALRTVGFLAITLGSLVGSVSDSDPVIARLDVVAALRIVGDLLILVSTPARLRRLNLVGVAIMLLLAGEALVILRNQGILHDVLIPSTTLYGVSLLSMLCMDCGIAILWNRFTRTILRIRLTDRFALAFSVFSVFLVILVTFSILAVLQTSLFDSLGLTRRDIEQAFVALNKALIILFISVVAASAIISVFLAQSLIAPVNRMSQALQAIGKGEWNTRLRGIHTRDEMRDLANEINTMSKRLRDADALRAEFVSFVSHELRNPLTTVKGFAETLRAVDRPGHQDMSPEERAEIYEIVCEECDRLIRMTNELLETSRVEAGKPVVLKLVTFDMVRLADKVAVIMGKHTDRHKITVEGPAKAVTIEADPDKIEQILINLLSNAIKYSPGGGDIDVKVRDTPSSIEIEVHDCGVGMSPEQSAHVFDKFYRIQDDQQAAGAFSGADGSGIGLYLTRALVHAHGGTIRVESEEGKGAVFAVTLPKRQMQPREDERAAVVDSGSIAESAITDPIAQA